MNPTASGTKGLNTHTYHAYDYAVGIGTGLVACMPGVFADLPNTPTRKLMGNLENGDAWSEFKSGAQNSGNVLTILHDNGDYTCYLHASPYDVNAYRGERVSKGEIFARSGHNGWSTGPHLHFEVWRNGVRIDPGTWLNNISTGGSMPSNAEQDAEYRLQQLKQITKEVSVDYVDGNSTTSAIGNIKSLYRLIDEKDREITRLNDLLKQGGSGGYCTPDERQLLDSLIKVTGG